MDAGNEQPVKQGNFVSHPPGQAAVSLLILTAGAAANRGRAGLDGSSGRFFKEQGQRPPVGGGFTDTLAVVAVALDLPLQLF